MKEWFYCDACDVTYLFRGNEVRGHKDDDEEVRCRQCYALLGHLRCDMPPLALLGRWEGDQRGLMPGETPDPSKVRKVSALTGDDASKMRSPSGD